MMIVNFKYGFNSKRKCNLRVWDLHQFGGLGLLAIFQIFKVPIVHNVFDVINTQNKTKLLEVTI